MTSTFYLPRKLRVDGVFYSEAEVLNKCLDDGACLIVLAEPGAGKTELLKSFAKLLKINYTTATRFKHSPTKNHPSKNPIIIDAFDELAKIDNQAIYSLLSKVQCLEPNIVILASRASEWSDVDKNEAKVALEKTIHVAYLHSFDREEQQNIFEHHAPEENFTTFYSEICRFDMENILSNPQFLIMMVDAYIESSGHFPDRQSIFRLAIERLVREANRELRQPQNDLSVSQKINIISELFAKLLLSGSEGVSTCEVSEELTFPLYSELIPRETPFSIFATRFFKPADNSNSLVPIHKIVMEYCAAKYLITKIENAHNDFRLSSCLPIIAPNSVPRDELRGLLGWMASFGNKETQETIITLDPYAVIANGDPSQLLSASKRLLLVRLQELEKNDPYFRRGDSWRTFSAVGFFTADVVEEVKTLLKSKSEGHLQGLILELLTNSSILPMLVKELKEIVFQTSKNEDIRIIAGRLLSSINSYDFSYDIEELIALGDRISLKIVAEWIALNLATLTLNFLEKFFRACVNLYPTQKNIQERIFGKRYFIRYLIRKLDINTTESLLDRLSLGLACTCGLPVYKCNCRIGISKIILKLTDHYFTLENDVFKYEKIWTWLSNLNLSRHDLGKNNPTISTLNNNIELRNRLLEYTLGKETNIESINTLRHTVFFDYTPFKYFFYSIEDKLFLINVAFKNNNTALWRSCYSWHCYGNEKKQDAVRSIMRKQAQENPSFMEVWAQQFRYESQHESRKQNRRASYVSRHWHRKNFRKNATYRKYIEENKERIKSGRDWNFLYNFSIHMLTAPDDLEAKFGDIELGKIALQNCLNFIEPNIPSLQELANLRCSSKFMHLEEVLFASCIEIMRKTGNLENVKPQSLLILRAQLKTSYQAIEAEEQDTLKTEVDRLLFPHVISTEQFLQQYLEPQLADTHCVHPELYFLQYDEVFKPLRGKLSIEWLNNFKEVSLNTLTTLFEIAGQFGDQDALKKIIENRCSDLLAKYPELTDDSKIETKRVFWFVRAFYFLNVNISRPYFKWLQSDKNSLFYFETVSGRMAQDDYSFWPRLTAEKLELLLNAFFVKWPKVSLPTSWGTDSPNEEKAYRFLKDLIWLINKDHPNEAIPVIERLTANHDFVEIHDELKSMHAEQIRKKALQDFEVPTPRNIIELLDNNSIVTVEGLRQRIIEELTLFQKDITGGEFNPVKRFYKLDNDGKKVRTNEVSCAEITAERLSLVLKTHNITIIPEHQTKDQNRIDITAAKTINGKRRLLVIEAKGQWHPELYTAAATQLAARYSIHPDAEYQGIYLVFWFGTYTRVANKKKHHIANATELKNSIEHSMPHDLKGRIDVFVLDVSQE